MDSSRSSLLAFHLVSTSSFVPRRVSTHHPAASLTRTRHALVCVSRPPNRIGAVAKDLQSALQLALQARTSRINLLLPSGARLGVEPRKSDEDAVQRRHAGDREAVRLVAGMFEGTGLSVSAVFDSARLSAAASKKWGPVECVVEDLGKDAKGGGKKKRKAQKGFGSSAEMEEERKKDVYIMVGGGAAFLERVRRSVEPYGMDTLVILVNPNSEMETLPVDLQRWKDEEFESVYHYETDPHPKWKGGVLFRKFPDDWVLCRLSPMGMSRNLLVSSSRPSVEEIEEALSVEKSSAGTGLLNKISSFIDGNS